MEHTFRVLVTDDEPGMRDGTVRALSRFTARVEELDATVAFVVETASSGEEALEIVEARRPDILLLDYKLPGISGLDVLARLQGRASDMITVMITAYASLETAITATKQGAFDFLTKPFTPQELRATVRKATNQLLLVREAQRLAEEKRRVRFEFISVLAHELKAPLNAVEGYLDLMLAGLRAGDTAGFEHALARSQARIQGMRKLIVDLLDMTRIESGAAVRELAEHDLTELARAAVEGQAPLAAQRGIRVRLEDAGPVTAVVDRGELEIVLSNLVSNAVKYNRDHGEVVVRVLRDRDAVRVEVDDTGVGMTDEETARLFNDFVRIRNRKTAGVEGSGLGLSTVRKIALLYGGQVTVRSVQDVGSTFAFAIPRADEPGGPQ